MIFFSDPSAEVNLQDEIRGAISSRLSFYAYRRPGDMIVSFGSSENTVEGIGTPGFVIAPFDTSCEPITIPWQPVGNNETINTSHYTFPVQSTTFPDYSDEINAIKEMLRKLGGGKTVASRVITIDDAYDVAATFSSLCRAYPSAFVFAFSTPQTGCWLGATPELLLNASGGDYHSMALAGTRPIGSETEWDIKNVEEQKMVADFIESCLERHGLSASLGTTFTQPAGGIEHICTPVSASIPSDFDTSRLSSLLQDLSCVLYTYPSPRD